MHVQKYGSRWLRTVCVSLKKPIPLWKYFESEVVEALLRVVPCVARMFQDEPVTFLKVPLKLEVALVNRLPLVTTEFKPSAST